VSFREHTWSFFYEI